MLRSATGLQGYSVGGTDGDMGEVRSLLFDDTRWIVRYLVIDTGKWLPGRKVLIPPADVVGVDPETRRIRLRLTRDKIRNSPDIDSDKPVSRQQETALGVYYGYGPYGGVNGLWGSAFDPPGMLAPLPPAAAAIPPPSAFAAGDPSAPAPDETESGDPHLRSTKVVSGYHVQATDDEIGHIEDFLVDDTWVIRYVVVDTSNWPGGRSVVISPQWVREIDWLSARVHVGVPASEVRRSTEFSSEKVLARFGDRPQA